MLQKQKLMRSLVQFPPGAGLYLYFFSLFLLSFSSNVSKVFPLPLCDKSVEGPKAGPSRWSISTNCEAKKVLAAVPLKKKQAQCTQKGKKIITSR